MLDDHGGGEDSGGEDGADGTDDGNGKSPNLHVSEPQGSRDPSKLSTENKGFL